MAKKRREKTEEDEVDFKLPKFDEEKFLKKERRNIKTLALSFLFGIFISVISFGFWVLLTDSAFQWELIVLVGVFNASWIRYFFIRLNIDLTDFGRKGWFTTYAVYFVTWLFVLIVLVNPPFYDGEAPNMTGVALPEMQEAGGSVLIVARIVDNVGINKDGITFTMTDPNGTEYSPSFTFDDYIFLYEHAYDMMGTYTYTLQAHDINGKEAETINGSFTYSNDTLKLASPANANIAPGPTITYADSLRLDVESTVSRCYYTVNESDEINATQGERYYETTPEFIGWRSGSNVTVKVYAEVIYYFPNVNQAFNNTIVDTETYYFTVNDDSAVGSEPSPEIKLPTFSPVQVPGFEAVLVIVALLVLLLIFKYKKKKP